MSKTNFLKVAVRTRASYVTAALLLYGCTLDHRFEDDAQDSPVDAGGNGFDESGSSGGAPSAGFSSSGGALGQGASGDASGGAGTSTGGRIGTGGGVGTSTGGSLGTGGTASTEPTEVRVMSLNVYGYATMPAAAPTYASLILSHNVDVLGIQEGVEDWKIQGLPTDYSRADALGSALGDCWVQSYQIFVNQCRGAKLIEHKRFDMSDGPNAARTGEKAVIEKEGKLFTFIDLHWDHEAKATRVANANETANAVNSSQYEAVIVVGDFNSGCGDEDANSMSAQSDLSLIVNGGIDCIFASSFAGTGTTVNASPSDHPGVVATLKL